jgi:CheY-like chemotaxis protein
LLAFVHADYNLPTGPNGEYHMKILVFDDSAIHRAAAEAQLKDHDLTVVSAYNEAEELLTPKRDEEKVNRIIKDQFGDFKFWESTDKEKKDAYFAAKDVAVEQSTTYPDFDVVLTDLLVPAPEKARGPHGEKYIGQEMPVGVFIAILAAVRGRAKFVGLLTDIDHHSHPASACLDAFRSLFAIEGCKVLFTNRLVDHFDPKDFSKALEGKDWWGRSDTVRAKNWARLLECLMR